MILKEPITRQDEAPLLFKATHFLLRISRISIIFEIKIKIP